MTINQLFKDYGNKNNRVKIFFKDAPKPSYYGSIKHIPGSLGVEEINIFFINFECDIHLIIEIKKDILKWFGEFNEGEQATLINKALSK